MAAGELDLHDVEAEMWERVIDLWDGVTPLPGLETYNPREIRRFWRWAVGQVDADRYLELVREGVRDADDPSTRACMEFSLLVQEGTAIDTDADPRALARFEERARTGPRDAVLAVFLNNLAEVYLNDGDRDRAQPLVQESAQIFAERGDTRDAMRARSFLALIDVLDGAPERGIDQLEALLAQGRDRVYVRRWVGNVLMIVHAMVGNADAANATFDLVATTLDTRLDWPTYEQQLNVIMRSWLDTGRWERAVRVYDELRPNWEGRLVISDLHAARLQLMRDGRVVDPVFWRDLPDRDTIPGGVDRVSADLIAAQVVGAGGDLRRMRALLEPVWTTVHPRYSDHALLGFLWTAVRDFTRIEVDAAMSGAADVHAAKSRSVGLDAAKSRAVGLDAATNRADAAGRAAARQHLETIAAYAGRMYRFGALGAAWGAELDAQLARFRGDGGQVALFETAASAWRAIGYRHDAAICELVLAEVRAALGERDAAREAAESALATARSLGAEPLVRRAGGVLHRLGSPGRSDGLLTRRELDVLALVAAGRTNNQIAKELFISPKTAGIHVSRIIAKFGAANRTEAAAIGRRSGLIPGGI